MSVIEPILQENKDRFVIFPIKHHDIWSWYKNRKLVFGQQKKLICIKTLQIGAQN